MIRSIFATEAHWYNDFLIEDGGLPRPVSYLTAAKLWHQRWWRRYPVFCMLLEQLPPPPYSRVSGLGTLPELHRVMDMLARLHSRWWGHAKAPPLEWVTHPGSAPQPCLSHTRCAEKLGHSAMAHPSDPTRSHQLPL